MLIKNYAAWFISKAIDAVVVYSESLAFQSEESNIYSESLAFQNVESNLYSESLAFQNVESTL